MFLLVGCKAIAKNNANMKHICLYFLETNFDHLHSHMKMFLLPGHQLKVGSTSHHDGLVSQVMQHRWSCSFAV
jgi:hypothetical protein